MKLKILSCVLFFSCGAGAKVPYSELDLLRKKTVVTRVAMDNLDFAWVKNCVPAVDKVIAAGSKLALATDNAAARWKKLSLTPNDLQEITKKIDICETRGSCSVYEVYLGAVQIPPELSESAAALRSVLEKKLENLSGKSYQKALAEIPQPCAILKSVVR